MTDRMWEATTNHAKTCLPGDKVYAHVTQHGTIYLNSIFNILRVDTSGVEWPLQQLNRGQTVSASTISSSHLPAPAARHLTCILCSCSGR